MIYTKCDPKKIFCQSKKSISQSSKVSEHQHTSPERNSLPENDTVLFLELVEYNSWGVTTNPSTKIEMTTSKRKSHRRNSKYDNTPEPNFPKKITIVYHTRAGIITIRLRMIAWCLIQEY